MFFGFSGGESLRGKGVWIRMDQNLYERVSRWFEEHREQMAADIMRLVRIPSISVPQEDDEAPFGEACRACLEEMLAIGREHGFYTENYGNRVGSIGGRDKDWENMIGFWNHMDVVPVGNGWIYKPFEPVLKEGFLIGRGAQDNKGPAVGLVYMMECLRELGISLKHELRLFVGCDEERGMADMEYYTARYPVPRLSMIADSGFPVCYGEKGIIEGSFHSLRPVSGTILEMAGGSASNMIPDAAYVVLRASEELTQALGAFLPETKKEEPDGQPIAGIRAEREPGGQPFAGIQVEREADRVRITAAGKSRHSAFPEGSVNAIHELMRFLAEAVPLPEYDRELFARLAYLSEEYYGEHTGIAGSDELSGRTTCAATVLWFEEGQVSLHCNIRYVITAEGEKLTAALKRTAEENGFAWETERDSAPNYFPREHKAVQLLTDVYNEITGSDAESFVMGGGTYARKLPRAFAYGVGGMKESEEELQIKARLLPPGHGGAHQPDEALNLRLLEEAMRIYAMAMLRLDECDI